MFFKFTRLSEQLVYIRWYDTPAIGDPAEVQFLEEAKAIIKTAEKPQYFISDLRKGRLTNIEVLHKLGSVARHPMWGGGTGFTHDPLSKIFAGIYVRFAKNAQDRDAMFERPEDALKFLESLKEGITQGIDWAEVLGMMVKKEDLPAPVAVVPATPESPAPASTTASTPEVPAATAVIPTAPEAPLASTTIPTTPAASSGPADTAPKAATGALSSAVAEVAASKSPTGALNSTPLEGSATAENKNA